MLAAGLLMGFGGAVAAADPDSGVSAAQGDDGTNLRLSSIHWGASRPKLAPCGDIYTRDGSHSSGG